MATKSSFPANVTAHTRVLYRLPSTPTWENAAVDERVAEARFEDALPARKYPAWKGKRHFEGLWWTTTTRAHVGFESLQERSWLVSADFDPTVVDIAAQPLVLLWPRATPGQKHHVPDYFARLHNGRGRLVDVKHDGEHGEKVLAQFELTRQACLQIGWEYEVWTGLPEPRSGTLKWFAGYRMDRYAPSPGLREFLIEGYGTSGCPLRVGVTRAVRVMGLSREVVLAAVYNLLWHHVLTMDLDSPVSLDSMVVSS